MFIQYRAFIGPRFDDYDWTNLDTDATTSLDVATTLSSDVNSGATTAALSSGSGFPTPGGVFLGPSAASNQQGWEYCKYTSGGSTLSGLVRESATTREHNGVHSAGAPAYLWYPVTTNTGDFTFSWQLNQTFAASTWEASISGVRFVPGVFLNNHICAVQYRLAVADSWKLFCLGFIDSPSVQDDFKSHANWTMRIVSSPQILDRQPAKGVRIGLTDIAKQGTASGSVALVLASDERPSGDFVAAEPDFAAGSMVDEDGADTIAIFERFHGPEQNFRLDNGDNAQQGGLRFSQLHLLPAAGLPPGARWIELVLIADSYENWVIYAADPLSPNNTYFWDLPSASGINEQEQDLIILCENEDVFRELNPLAEPAAIFENQRFFSRLTHTGGALWLRETAFWKAYVRWGNANGDIQHPSAPDPDAWWTGPALTVQTFGQTYRYIHGRTGLTNSKDWWDVGLVKTPGYAIAEDYDTYATIELPGIDLFLNGDITSSAPANGGTLQIKDKAGNKSTAGLDESGTLQIGDEQFNYNIKAEGYVVLSAERGTVNGSAAAAHKDGDPVYVMVGGIKTNCPPISQISWHHYNGSIHIRDFTVHRSLSTIEPRSPEDDGTLTDWTAVATVAGSTASSWSYTFSTAQRIKRVLIRIAKINSAPARARINDFKAILDTSAYISGLWLASGISVYMLVRQIVLNAGFPGNSIIQSGTGHPTLDNLTTADDQAWAVAADIADFSGCRLLVGRDSKMSFAVDTYWTGSPSPSHIWTKSNASAAEKVWSNGLGVSQMKLPWRTADGATKGTEVYPATAGNFGNVTEQKEHVYANAGSAQAAVRKYYCLARYPYTAVVDVIGGDLSVAPGQIHRLQWQFADSPREINRLYIVTGVDHHVTNNYLSTSISLAQIDRESEN